MPIEIVGFTPLAVILAERLSYFESDISLIEKDSSTLSIDNHWQSVSLLCLINLLKQSRKLLTKMNSNEFRVSIKINEDLLYTFVKLTTERIRKYYLSLLKQRQVKLRLSDHVKDKTCLTYVTYGQSLCADFDRSPRLNGFHSIFQCLLHHASVKFIGRDIFGLEFAHLLASISHHQVYFYRMNPKETSFIPQTPTNHTLINLFQVFSKSKLQIIEQFHQFKLNPNVEGQLEYEKLTKEDMPLSHTAEDIKKSKRSYLETFRQSIHESTIKLAELNIHTGEYNFVSCFSMSKKKKKNSFFLYFKDDKNRTNVELLDVFSLSSTYFVLPDGVNLISETKDLLLLDPLPNAVRTFNSTPGSLISGIYETLRVISKDETIPRLKNIFLSIDHELCVVENPHFDNIVFGADQIIESEHHNFYKIIQRPVDAHGHLKLRECQLFQTNALDLQSLLLLFHSHQTIPSNEFMFLFRNESDWHNLLILPDC